MSGPVHLVPHNPDWAEAFKAQVPVIQNALGENAVGIIHIGSTAIPGILAKPVVDILVEVRNLEEIDACAAAMIDAGFEAKGEYGIPERRYFRRSTSDGTRTHHVHVFKVGSHHVVRHVVFRDYMLAHPEMAQAYSDLKASLAALPGPAYQEAKGAFVEKMQDVALNWVRARKG